MYTGVGNSFRVPELWTGPFYGTRATLAADVNSDGLVDLIAVNDSSTFVMYSNGHGFSAPLQWSGQPSTCSRGTFAADITGSGNASLIAINDQSTWVMTSNWINILGNLQQWSNQPFYGSRATLMTDAADITGKRDLIAVNDSSTWVSDLNRNELQRAGAMVVPALPWQRSAGCSLRSRELGNCCRCQPRRRVEDVFDGECIQCAGACFLNGL